MSQETESTKGVVLAAIDRERDAWETLLVEVGEARMLEPGVMGDWTFKDLAAHITGWRARSLQRLEAAANGQPEPDPVWPADRGSDDEINDWIHEALNDPDFFPWLEGNALGPVIVSGEFFSHLHEEHEPDIRRWLQQAA